MSQKDYFLCLTFEVMLKVLQILFSFVILPLFLVGTFHYSFVTFNFQLNREYITETFCINKDKPQLACEGQCHFMQQMNQLKTADEERNGDDKPNQEERTITLFYSEIALNTTSIPFKILSYPVINNSISDGYKQLVKAPPKA